MKDAMNLAAFLKGHLKSVADGAIDTGLGFGRSDLWVTIEGREFLITVVDKSAQQIVDDDESLC